MRKNIIITVLFVAVVLLGIYGRFQFVEAKNLKVETNMIFEEVNLHKQRSEMLASEASKQAARATKGEAQIILLEQELKEVKSKLASCK